MEFNFRTTAYLKEMEAVLVESTYKVTNIDFHNLKAFVNKVDTFKKRNGKFCKVEHHFGKWITFPKEFVRYGKHTITGTTNDWSVGDREEYTYDKTVKYLTKESKEEIVKLYHLSARALKV